MLIQVRTGTPVLLIRYGRKVAAHVNQPIAHAFLSDPDDSSAGSRDNVLESFADVAVGDVVIRREESGYGIFNYRGERVLDQPMRTAGEAERLAAEIVAPWQGRVRFDSGSR